MVMSDEPKPRSFQFHLLTAIVLMFVAGGFLALNVIPSRPIPKYYIYERGWPFMFCRWFYDGKNYLFDMFDAGALINDSLLALACIALSAKLCEFLIRRRKTQKDNCDS